MKLSQRKNDILLAIVEDYIKEASPITSGVVKDRHLPNISSATLRTELNALEAMGFLRQLHTSGGRVPTTEGYRYYVESLFSKLKIDNLKLDRVSKVLSEKTKSIREIVAELARIISEITNSSTVVMMNEYNNLCIEEVRIVPLIDSSALILIRTKNGFVNNAITTSATQKDCDDAGRLLTKKFTGKTIGYMIDNINEVEEAINNEVKDYKSLVECLICGLKELTQRKAVGIRQSGAGKLLESGKKDSVDGAMKVLNILEDEEELELILKTENKGITCKFADDKEEYSGLAVVKAPLIVSGQNVGTVGVFGPQRMDYLLVASAIKYLTSELENLDRLESNKNNKDEGDENGKK